MLAAVTAAAEGDPIGFPGPLPHGVLQAVRAAAGQPVGVECARVRGRASKTVC